MRVDSVDVLAELGAGGGIDLLNTLEATRLDEGLLGLGVLGKNLGELGSNVGEDVVGGEDEEGFEGRKVSAHLDDILEGLLGFVLKVGGALAFLHHVDGEESGGDVSLGEVLGVVGRVTADLSEGPGGGSLDVILRLVDEGVLERSNTLGDDNSHGEGVIEGRDVTEGHDTWETGISLGLADVVNGRSSATGVDDQLGKLRGLLGNLTDASGGVLAHLHIDILQAVENPGEDLSLNNDFGEVDGVLGDLSEALADVALELGVGVRDQSGQVGNGSLVNDSLRQLLGVFGDLGQGSGGDALEGELGLLDAEDKESNGASIDNGLSKVSVVLGDAGKSEGSGLLDRWVKLLEAVDEGAEGTGVDHSLGEVRGVLGDGAEHVSSSLLVESLRKAKQAVTMRFKS